jgi:hypothetical protein
MLRAISVSFSPERPERTPTRESSVTVAGTNLGVVAVLGRVVVHRVLLGCGLLLLRSWGS